MNNIVKQILIGSALGDGHITKNGTFTTGSKHLSWIQYKASILTEYISDKWYRFVAENGYCKTPYHTLRTLVHSDIKQISKMSLQEKLNELDELGLAVWFYDDGSLHKHKLFYNLNTHSFTEQEHIQFILPALMGFGIKAKTLKERKQDGREFTYTYIGRRFGAQTINRVLKTYSIDCYKYKTFLGNINEGCTVRSVKTTNKKTNKTIIHSNGVLAAKYLKTFNTKFRKAIKDGTELNGHVVTYYYYE